MSRRRPRWRLQTREPGRAYVTIETSHDEQPPHWQFHQHLVPWLQNSVRILDARGRIVVRATPKKAR